VLAPPLGLGSERDWPSAQVRLDGTSGDASRRGTSGDASRGDGWSVLMFTDGLIEGRIGKGSERLGSEGLMDLIRVVLGSAPNFADDRLLDKVIDQVRELNGGDLDDDLAILCVSCD
jgi:hypothetical protein